MRTPRPPHHGQCIVPTVAIRSTGTSARPKRPIRTRTQPSPTSTSAPRGASGMRKGSAQGLRAIGKRCTATGGGAARSAGKEAVGGEELPRLDQRRPMTRDDRV